MPKPDKSKLLCLAIHMGKFGKKWDETEEEKKEREKAEKERAEQEAKDIAEGKPVKPKLVVGKLDKVSMWRSEFAYITRNSEVICVPPGHPLYAKAKEEQERNKRLLQMMMHILKDFLYSSKKNLMRSYLIWLMMNPTLLFSNKSWMKPRRIWRRRLRRSLGLV